MNLWQSMRLAWRELGRNKMRTGLTMLGVIIGVSAVITMVGLGTGAGAKVSESIASLGTNLLTVQPGNPMSRFGGQAGTGSKLTEDDAKAITHHFPQSVMAVAPQARGAVQVRLGDKTWQTQIVGTTPDYRSVNNAPVDRGRFITQSDVDGRLKVALLGPTVVDQLMGSYTANPVGMDVLVNRISFHVVGVLKSKGSGAFGQDQDDVIVIPVSTALRRVLNRTYLSSIGIEAASKGDMDLATEQMSRLLRQRHHILPPYDQNDDFNVRSQTGLMETFQTATSTMTNLLAGIAVVSLIVGGIGIMNIMLVSVSERTREIGLRKAVGATSRDIRLQFVIESCVIAGVGGLFGVGLGVLGANLLGRALQTNALITPQSVILSVGVAAATGLFFGIYPAQKAAQLSPIEALRYE
ncbi:MAG: ABC transporter permease [Armatimonadota bacterium]